MNTTLTVKMPKKLRDDAKKTAQELGVPLTTVINALARQFVRDRQLTLQAECPFPSHTPNRETRKAIREMNNSKLRGRSFATANEIE
ncbi:MAG: hypothetical protein AAB798_01405 [Patescibacteria group bacterium]